MNINLVVPSLAYGDAIGNDVLAQKSAIISMGYRCEIYADWIDERLPRGSAQLIRKINPMNDDIVIYHFGSGNPLCYKMAALDCRKVIRYHNVTPPEFYRKYSANAYEDASDALKALSVLSNRFDYGLAVSEFNRRNLIDMGYTAGIDVLPILIPFSDYEKKPDFRLMKKYDDGKVNILFTGRIAPHKKVEDIIQAFAYYRQINPESRLILAGSGIGERYHQKLEYYISKLEPKPANIIFTGHLKFAELLALWRVANVYMSMSEHEGFGVPLVEAMYFKVPVIARDCAAIPETLGNSGFLLPDNNPKVAAEAIHEIINNSELRNQIVEAQKERLKDFDNKRVIGQLKEYIGRM
jgi:glycosyltransferase involved in cell wall biosynthesis